MSLHAWLALITSGLLLVAFSIGMWTVWELVQLGRAFKRLRAAEVARDAALARLQATTRRKED